MAVRDKISVLVVDDSSVMRILVSDIINSDNELYVKATASNGREAVYLTHQHKPDVILMDLYMGQFSGVDAIREIMNSTPTSIIVLSAAGNNDFNIILEALNEGAVEYVNKPIHNSISLREMNQLLIAKVKSVANTIPKATNKVKVKANIAPHTFSEQLDYDVVAIGASTGGPTAIEQILKKLPENFAIPILIAQHMPENFIHSFAQRLNRLSPLTIKMADKGELLQPKTVYIAPGHSNMIVESLPGKKSSSINFSSEIFKEFNNPSADALLLSVSKVFSKRSIGIILTGMGKDGALGLKAIAEAGGSTIVQTESSCIVYGMPREAVRLGAARHIIDITEMGPFLVGHLS